MNFLASRLRRCIPLSAALLIAGSTGLQNASAENETRTLSLFHTHTKESATITFKRNGRYDEGGLAQLNHFLRDWRNDQKTKMDPQLFDAVWEVYQDVGASQPVQIISAYRSPATNSMLRSRSRGVAKFSQHMLGKAMDFNLPGVPLERVRAAGLRAQRGGVGFYPSSGSPFVHVDVGSVRHWPRMTPDQLARVFPDGRTVHVPTDGKPLRGYEQAVADLERRGKGSSSPARTLVAQADTAGGAKRGLLSRLFGGGNDDDEAETAAPARKTPAARRPAEERETAQPAETQVASIVPMPRPRPAPAAAYQVIAAAPATPIPVSPPGSAAAEVQNRGIWTGKQARVAAAEPTGPRLVWQTGPQGRPVATQTASALPSVTASIPAPTPRPRPTVALASAGPQTTASLPPWPIGRGAEDRIPSDLVLAYAAQAPVASDPPAVRAAPMGSLQPSQTRVAARPTAPARNTTAAVAKGGTVAAATASAAKRLVGNPWLRGVMLSPSVHTAMDVVSTGVADYRELVRFMQKPSSALAMGFTDSPAVDGPQSFSGSAVGFLPTVTFSKVTASLN